MPMLDRRKQRRELERQKREVEDRIQRTAKHGDVSNVGYSIAVSRWEIHRLDAQLKELDAQPWIERAKRHRIKVPDENEYWDAWQVDEASTHTVLSSEGKHFITAAIREKRFKFMRRWGAVIAILTSILSLIVSIIALTKK